MKKLKYSGFFILIFKEEFNELFQSTTKNNENILNGLFDNINQYLNEKEINYILDCLIQLNSLKYTKNVYQNVLFTLNILKNNKELSLMDDVDKTFFDNYEDTFNINDNLIWTIYKEDLNESKSDKKYLKTILKGIMTENEKSNFDIFNNLNKIKIKEDIKGIDAGIFKSICFNTKILILKIDIEYFKNNKITLDQIKDEIKLIQKYCPSEYKNIVTYIRIENKIINFEAS